jgi:hypothetical protein
MFWGSRKLRLLYINDDQGDGKFAEHAGKCVHIEPIDSLPAATEFLLRERPGDGPPFVDFVFSDANMELDHSHDDNILWAVDPDDDPVRAFGPLLALPFLSAPPWCQFVPFSAYWTNPNVYQNGYTLVAIAIILTAIDREKRSTGDAQRKIDDWRGKVEETTLPALLPKALSDLRVKIVDLCMKGKIHLNGVDTTIHDLKLWKLQAAENPIEQRKLPLALGNEPICVELLHPGHHAHLIQVSSLFADVLDFSEPTGVAQIQTIIDALSAWTKLDHAYPTQSHRAYEIARKLLYRFMPGLGNDEDEKKRRYWTLMLRDKISEEYKIAPGTDTFDFVVRLTILLAHVRSWYLAKYQPGFSVANIREYVYHFLGSDRPPESGKPATPQVPFRRLLGEKGGNLLGDRRYQRPFKDLSSCLDSDGGIDLLKAFMLEDENEEGTLEWREKLLCRYFVQSGHVHCDDEPNSERTAWNPAYYPRWMLD